MVIVGLILLLALILGGIGFAVHILWWLAIAAFVVFLVSFLVHGTGRGRYR